MHFPSAAHLCAVIAMGLGEHAAAAPFPQSQGVDVPDSASTESSPGGYKGAAENVTAPGTAPMYPGAVPGAQSADINAGANVNVDVHKSGSGDGKSTYGIPAGTDQPQSAQAYQSNGATDGSGGLTNLQSAPIYQGSGVGGSAGDIKSTIPWLSFWRQPNLPSAYKGIGVSGNANIAGTVSAPAYGGTPNHAALSSDSAAEANVNATESGSGSAYGGQNNALAAAHHGDKTGSSSDSADANVNSTETASRLSGGGQDVTHAASYQDGKTASSSNATDANVSGTEAASGSPYGEQGKAVAPAYQNSNAASSSDSATDSNVNNTEAASASSYGNPNDALNAANKASAAYPDSEIAATDNSGLNSTADHGPVPANPAIGNALNADIEASAATYQDHPKIAAGNADLNSTDSSSDLSTSGAAYGSNPVHQGVDGVDGVVDANATSSDSGSGLVGTGSKYQATAPSDYPAVGADKNAAETTSGLNGGGQEGNSTSTGDSTSYMTAGEKGAGSLEQSDQGNSTADAQYGDNSTTTDSSAQFSNQETKISPGDSHDSSQGLSKDSHTGSDHAASPSSQSSAYGGGSENQTASAHGNADIEVEVEAAIKSKHGSSSKKVELGHYDTASGFHSEGEDGEDCDDDKVRAPIS